MKGIEGELKSIKADYGDKITPQLRQKLEKYALIFKELGKVPTPKVGEVSCRKMIANLESELAVLRRQIEGEIKVTETDYKAFVWKTENIMNSAPPTFFKHLKFSAEKPKLAVNKVRKDFNYPILETPCKDLISIGSELIMENSFCRENYDERFIVRLLKTISNKYNIMAYHNFTHAFSVFLMFFQCAEISPTFKSLFGDFEFFVAYVAALCHDMNHKGTNSGYEIKKKTDLAARYSNESVLENMHVSQFYRMNKENPDLDIISRIKSPAQKIAAKRLLNQLILATDIMSHKKSLDKLKDLSGKDIKDCSVMSKEIILENIFHACDIGNPALQFNNYINWSILLAHEFNTQAQLQKKQSLDVTPNFAFKDIKSHYQGQIGFIGTCPDILDYLAFPLWKEIGVFFPQLKTLTKSMAANKSKLQELVSSPI